jgi:hypothetical protein
MGPPDPATVTDTLRAPSAENTHWALTFGDATTSNTVEPVPPVVAEVGFIVIPVPQAAVIATSGKGVGF